MAALVHKVEAVCAVYKRGQPSLIQPLILYCTTHQAPSKEPFLVAAAKLSLRMQAVPAPLATLVNAIAYASQRYSLLDPSFSVNRPASSASKDLADIARIK